MRVNYELSKAVFCRQKREKGINRLYKQAILLQLIMSASAYTVLDSVNKYRHGVLIGNFVEDKFGKDLHERGPVADAPKVTTTQMTHTLLSSLHKQNPYLASQVPDKSQFYATGKSFSGQSYKRPEAETTYNIYHHRDNTSQVPLVSNNPKLQQKLEAEGRAYDITRQQLANKFTRPAADDPSTQSLPDEIPDILTGQIFKPKPSLGSEQYFDQKGKPKIEGSVKTKSINPYGTYSVIKPEIQKFEDVEYNKLVKPHHKGEHRDILFGHGLALEDFQKRQMATSYDLSYNQRIPPQTQVNSFYEPDIKNTARQFHKTSLYQKSHQEHVPAYGDTKILGQHKQSRPYQPYTATYDKNHLKHEYLRK